MPSPICKNTAFIATLMERQRTQRALDLCICEQPLRLYHICEQYR